MTAASYDTETAILVKVDELLAELDTLLRENESEKTRLSIYVPAGPLPSDVSHARLHLKNAVDEGEKMLREVEGGDEVIAVLKRSIGYLLDRESEENEFWQNQRGGLAVLVDDSTCRLLQTAKNFLPSVVAGPKFHLTPLLELAANVDSYWLLSLSVNEIKLYRGSRLGIREIEIPGDIQSFESSETAENRSSGDDPDLLDAKADKENLERFFGEVDEAVRKVLKGSTDPLLLAGVDFYLPVYAKANAYPYLVESIVSGNAERQEMHDLHRRASDALRLEFSGSRRREYLRLKALGESDVFLGNLGKIFQCLVQGRVKNLVVPTDAALPGRLVDPAGGSFQKLSPGTPGAYDLYQEAAEMALRQGASLFYLETAKMPNGYRICAELRY